MENSNTFLTLNFGDEATARLFLKGLDMLIGLESRQAANFFQQEIEGAVKRRDAKPTEEPQSNIKSDGEDEA